MKTFLLYIGLNLLVYPVYMIAIITGMVGGFVSNGTYGLGDYLIAYFITLIPNIILLIIIQIWGNRFKLNKKMNVVYFTIAAFMLFHYIIIEPTNFKEIWL